MVGDEPQTWQRRGSSLESCTNAGLRDGHPYAFGIDNKDRIWTSTYRDDRLHMFDPKTERFTTYLMPSKGNGLRDFFLDEKGWLWAGVFGRNQVIGFTLDDDE